MPTFAEVISPKIFELQTDCVIAVVGRGYVCVFKMFAAVEESFFFEVCIACFIAEIFERKIQRRGATDEFEHTCGIVNVGDFDTDRGVAVARRTFGDGCFGVTLGHKQTLQRAYRAVDTGIEIAVIVVCDSKDSGHTARHI